MNKLNNETARLIKLPRARPIRPLVSCQTCILFFQSILSALYSSNKNSDKFENKFAREILEERIARPSERLRDVILVTIRVICRYHIAQGIPKRGQL